MNITAMMTMAVMAGVMVEGGAAGQTTKQKIIVCTEGGAGFVESKARAIASGMFADIDIAIDWRQGFRGCLPLGILISFSSATPAALHPGVLAYALPYEGTRIVIFYDRVLKAVHSALIPRLLAHVLVHEITHILQGVSRHSDDGVMKARWDGSDYSAMSSKPLAFASEDIGLIHRGLAARAARSASPQVDGEHGNQSSDSPMIAVILERTSAGRCACPPNAGGKSRSCTTRPESVDAEPSQVLIPSSGGR